MKGQGGWVGGKGMVHTNGYKIIHARACMPRAPREAGHSEPGKCAFKPQSTALQQWWPGFLSTQLEAGISWTSGRYKQRGTAAVYTNLERCTPVSSLLRSQKSDNSSMANMAHTC